MSIGSETNGGVRNVSVCDLSLDGTDNGLRIKSDASRGGLVQGIYYTDVCIRNSRHPLVFDAYYSSSTGTLIPDYRDVVRQQRPRARHGRPEHVPWLGRRASDRHHPQQRRLRQRADLDQRRATPTSCSGPRPVNIKPMGTGVTVTDQVTGSRVATGLHQRLGDLLNLTVRCIAADVNLPVKRAVSGFLRQPIASTDRRLRNWASEAPHK